MDSIFAFLYHFWVDSTLGFSGFLQMGLLHLLEDSDFGFLDSKTSLMDNLYCTLAFCEACVQPGVLAIKSLEANRYNLIESKNP